MRSTRISRRRRSGSTPEAPIRIRVAAVLLGLIGIALFIYTLSMTISLVLHPDPMFGLEIIVSAMLLVAAGGAIGLGIGLARPAAWGRPIAIGAAVLLILIAGALPFITPARIGEAAQIEPVVWLLGAAGVGLLTLVIKPYRPG